MFLLVFFLLLIFFLQYVYKFRSRLSYIPKDNDIFVGQIIEKTSVIPNIIHQTYYRKDRIPVKVSNNFSIYASQYKRIVYDDKDIEIFLAANFKPSVLHSFKNLKYGAHKADLFRYAILYVYGGIYMDIKTELVKPLEKFPNGQITTVKSIIPTQIYQGLIAAPPRQDIFLFLISAITRSGNEPPYALFIREFMRFIEKDTRSLYGFVKEGVLIGKRHTYNLLQEVCSRNASDCEDGLDRYGRCCKITSNGKRIIKSRYADFGILW